MHILRSWLILSAAVWVTATLLPGFEVKRGWALVKVAALIGILQWALGWFFTVVLVIGTLGIAWVFLFITRWIVSAIILKIADSISDNIRISSFGVALLASLIMSFVGTVAEALLRHF